jgi:ppGpp synthetase/RelA/SpoT-type nucleotidyltranferase
MDIQEYETTGRARYERLATVVELILKNTILQLDGIANTPQTQKRTKDPESLKRKLADRVVEAANDIEAHIKDLAGCRIIFHTNIDLERFRQASTWTDDFEVDWRASKTHFPRTEDASAEDLYQGIHYVVCLKPGRTSLVEYADLAGLRCEVQLQTILNHAWSETSHDVLYKGSATHGFGAHQQEVIKKRFANVMRQHLMLAEYEMQKIQSDVERLRTGQAIFDEAPLQQLAAAKDNNARYETLDKIKQHLLPGLDDVSAHLRDIRRVAIEAIEAARTAPIVDREGPLGGFKGATSEDVLRRGLEILNDLRYGYIEEAFEGLVRLWQGADADDREKIDKTIEKLAEYNLALEEALCGSPAGDCRVAGSTRGRWKTKHPACCAGREHDCA